MQEIDVHAVNAAFKCLQPVAFLDESGHRSVRRRNLRPVEERWRRLPLRGTHVGPDNTADLVSRVGSYPNSVLEVAGQGLRWHVHAATIDVELPTVVNATESLLLVASPKQG